MKMMSKESQIRYPHPILVSLLRNEKKKQMRQWKNTFSKREGKGRSIVLLFHVLLADSSGQAAAAVDEAEDMTLLVFSEESLKQLQKRIEELKTERAQQKNKFK